MPAPERVNEEEGGEPQKSSAIAPTHQGELYRWLEPEINSRLKPEAGPASLFTESLSYELNRSLRGAAQLVGAEGSLTEPVEPQQAPDLLGQNVQMLGRAAGGVLPMLGIAIGTRYGFGKVLAHDAQAVEHALLKRTAVGLSAAESGATGLLYGSLLTPTEGAAKDDLGSFAVDRLKSGASSGLAFALMSASNIGMSKLASTELGVTIGAEKLMKIGAVSGIISGIPGGIANVEADSLVRTGKLDFDKERLGRSMYEMALFGGTFGLGAGLLGRVSSAGRGVDMTGGSMGKDLAEANGFAIPEQHFALTDDYRPAANLPAEARRPHRALPAARASSAEITSTRPGNDSGKIVSRTWTRESFVNAIGEGRDLRRADLRGLDLSGINFEGLNLDAADFRGSNLRGADFSKATSLELTWFDDADLAGADFSGRNLRRASFRRALNYAQAKFEGANLGGSDLSGSDLRAVDFSKVADLSHVNFEGAALDGANFSNKDVSSSAFRGATLANAIFENATLKGADFSGSNLTGANFRNSGGFTATGFYGADLSNVNFSGANLANVDFTGAKAFRHVVFDDASFLFASFAECDLTGVDFSKAKGLSTANFTRANLDHVSFAGQYLEQADFRRAQNLSTVNFSDAHVPSADFRDTDLRNVDFSKVADLTRVRFDFADLAGTDFSGKDLREVSFWRAKTVTKAKFDGADIRYASFADTDLTLSHYFAADSGILQRLAQLPAEFEKSTGLTLAKFIFVNPLVHKGVLERELLKEVPLGRLSEERLLGLAGLQSYYGEDSPVMRALTGVENDNNFLFFLATYIKENPESRSKFVAETALGGAAAKELSPMRLSALTKLEKYFQSDLDGLQQLLVHEKNGRLTLDNVAGFIQDDPEKHTEIVRQELEQNKGQDPFPGQFDYSRLKALSSLTGWFGKNADLMVPIFKLEREGLPLRAVAGLLNEDPVKQAHVQTLIAQGASLEKVQKAMREDAGGLAHYLNPSDGEYLEHLIENRLRTGQLRAFVADDPTARLEFVKELIQKRETVQRFHDQMDLSMLPDDVASRLLDNNTVPVPQLIGAMRNWQSGSYFREALIEQVKAGETISRSVIDALSARAQEMAREKEGSRQLSFASRNQSVSASQASAELKAESASDSQVSKESGEQSESGNAAKEQTFPITNPRAIEAANIITEALERIVAEIPEEKTIVVLGRDALPLYPALRNQGRKVQYFLWSRLQENDKATGEQWLREVGPGAVVIDTGYAGSIPDAVRRIDPTASAYLLSSKSQYPQLLERNDHSAIVNNLEYFPKLVARSRTYTKNGGAVSRPGNTDEHDGGEILKNRWTVESLNRQFLRAIGLDEWGAWRYSRYAGLTPAERLGLNTQEEVERHYLAVKQAREVAAGETGR